MPRYLVTLRRFPNLPTDSVVIEAPSNVEATRTAEQLGEVVGLFPMVESAEGVSRGEADNAGSSSTILGSLGVAFAAGSILLPFLLPISFTLGGLAIYHGHRNGGSAILASIAVCILWVFLLATGVGNCTFGAREQSYRSAPFSQTGRPF